MMAKYDIYRAQLFTVGNWEKSFLVDLASDLPLLADSG
jgi:hypothetical protein